MAHEEVSKPEPVDLVSSASWLGRHHWIEMQTFAVVGGWVGNTPEHPVKLYFGEQSHHHAWRGDVWRRHLPRLQEMPEEQFVGPPSEAWAIFIATLRGVEDPLHTIERLVGSVRVLGAHLVAEYRHRLQALVPVTDQPTMRSLRLVLHDAVEDQLVGESLLADLLRTDDDVEQAAEAYARWATLLLATRGE